MQILYVHPDYPAEFGYIASRLASRPGVEYVFVTLAQPSAHDDGRWPPLPGLAE